MLLHAGARLHSIPPSLLCFSSCEIRTDRRQCLWRLHACSDESATDWAGLTPGRYFTWDKHLFPDPVRLQDDIAAHGRKTVTIIDPHIKKDDGYYIFQEAQQHRYYVQNKDGSDYEGCAAP
jgi:alpha-glucosidase (family GH31 glycosyl hydrolase)